jgi:beta-lactamase regulating signal transducer with metallopeptidase domain
MSSAMRVLESPWLIVIGWAVVFSLWSTTMSALALAVWRLARRRASAERQYRAAVVSLLAALVLSLALPLAVATNAMTLLTRAPSSTAEPVPSSSVGPGSSPRSATSPSLGWPRAIASVPPASAVGFLGVTWLLGVAVCMARLVGGWIVATRISGDSVLVDQDALRNTFDRVRTDAGVDHVRLTVSMQVDAPVAVGARLPTVVLPGYFLDRMPPDSITPILAHEIAHVKRRDYVANLVLSAVEAALFHSPATWWIARRVREAREFSCDDAAIVVAGSRRSYVDALMLVARLGAAPGPRPLLGMAGPRLITRITRLLEGEPVMKLSGIRTSVATACALLVGMALPVPFEMASAHLTSRLSAAGMTQDAAPVPLVFPLRQEGSAVRIRRVESNATHACGTFEVTNAADVAVSRIKAVAVLEFARSANLPVRIVESEWSDTRIAPGATATLDFSLIDIAAARREAAGLHVQATCAIREVVYGNRASWSVTPNPAATTGREAMGWPLPSLPRSLVGQPPATTSAAICIDDKGAEYSPGASIGIRDEPGRSARCSRDGRWVEGEQ